ncbi:dienelactone hydrolase family protein [Streptomyces sp. NPDC006134]|uniref:dienelactone hydrolase family protein n=1 Tax=Streptomyces sp. NPDC006134 TaxID=3154467 RepID=UPI0033D1017A
MAEVPVFRHGHGLTTGVREFAEYLRRAGHTVHAPDLYEGQVFDSLEEGVGYAGNAGFGMTTECGIAAAEGLPAELVHVGFSLGVMPRRSRHRLAPAQRKRCCSRHAVPVSDFGEAWSQDVPVQVHGMDTDPFFAGEGDVDAARAVAGAAADAELFLCPGGRHLFAGSSLLPYGEPAATQARQRVLDFLPTASRTPGGVRSELGARHPEPGESRQGHSANRSWTRSRWRAGPGAWAQLAVESLVSASMKRSTSGRACSSVPCCTE